MDEQSTPAPIAAQNHEPKNNSARLWLLLLIIPVGVIAYLIMNQPSNNQPVANSANTPAANPITVNYKDGVYNADGKYTSPAGVETVGINLTLKNNVITDAAATVQAVNPASKKWQTTFAAGLKQAVVGQNINSLQLDKISGSSLTTQGFNDALAAIEAQAKS